MSVDERMGAPDAPLSGVTAADARILEAGHNRASARAIVVLGVELGGSDR